MADRMTGPDPAEAFRYRAFISYSHRDKAVARWLHHALETYPIPPKLVGAATPLGPAPKRLTPIFRDQDELPASGDLGDVLMEALRQSRFLVVICSPAAARSQWVEQEILAFKLTHGEGRVLALIVDGLPYASTQPGLESQECFPKALRFRLNPDGELSDAPAEPLASDLRRDKDGRRLAKLKLVAGLTGLRLDDLAQRETQRRVRNLAAVTIASMTGMVAAGGLAAYANLQRIEAERQRAIAERESAASRAASDFLISTFRLANTATENPRTVTAVSILDRGAARVRSELRGQPQIEARLLATVANAYINLGLSGAAKSLLDTALPDLRRGGAQGARALEGLAIANAAEGHLASAMRAVELGEQMLGPNTHAEPEIRGLLERARARILFLGGDPKGGLKAVDRALSLLNSAPSISPKTLAATLQTKGQALSDDGQFDAADAVLTQALELTRKAVGEHDLLTGEALETLGMNDLAAGRLASAESRLDAALEIERRVLSPDNPLLADAIALQGQVYQGEHKLGPAEAALQGAIATYNRAFGRPNAQTGIQRVYLALVESEMGQTAAALSQLDLAKRDYDIGYGKLHPNHGDLLVNRARVLARAGRRTEAVADCAAGIRILDQTLGADAAFTKANREICRKL